MKKQDLGGFTLIEMMVVMAVLGILAASASQTILATSREAI